MVQKLIILYKLGKKLQLSPDFHAFSPDFCCLCKDDIEFDIKKMKHMSRKSRKKSYYIQIYPLKREHK